MIVSLSYEGSGDFADANFRHRTNLNESAEDTLRGVEGLGCI
jgi:hypothetical protein